jgi:mannose-6-phosphate isomerase
MYYNPHRSANAVVANEERLTEDAMPVMLEPLFFHPVYKDYIWGGRRLASLGKELPPAGPVAESWEISGHPNGVSVIANGPLRGKSLPEAVRRCGASLLGEIPLRQAGGKRTARFPLLIKLIDTNGWLSVQVHPGDGFAARHEPGESGKNEMWAILAAEPEACLIAGIRPGTSQQDLASALRDGPAPDLLPRIPVRAGDVVNIPAGLVHAAGPGLLIYEVQQNSDITYRLHDFGRTDPSGQPRPLHLEKGLAAIDYRQTAQAPRQGLPLAGKSPCLVRRLLVLNRYFGVEELTLRGEASFAADRSRFQTLTVTRGEGELAWQGPGNRKGLPAWHSLPLKQGQSLLLPASLGSWRLSGSMSAMACRPSDFADDLLRAAELADADGPGGLARQSGLGEADLRSPAALISRWRSQVGFDPLPEDLMGCGGAGF